MSQHNFTPLVAQTATSSDHFSYGLPNNADATVKDGFARGCVKMYKAKGRFWPTLSEYFGADFAA